MSKTKVMNTLPPASTAGESAKPVRRTVTKKTPKWARTTDGIVLRWEEHRDGPRTLSGLRLDDRLRRLFVAACCRSALPGKVYHARPLCGSVREVLGALREWDEPPGRTSAQVADATRLRWFEIATEQSREYRTPLGVTRLPVALLFDLAGTRRRLRYAAACDAAAHAARIVAHRVKRPRRSRSYRQAWSLNAQPGPENDYRQAVVYAEFDERTRQGRLLAGIVGPEWHLAQEWRTDTAVQLARAIYENREFTTMPILADALEDAGCDNAGWLDRMRDTSWPWCRGCHVLDSLLPELVHTGRY